MSSPHFLSAYRAYIQNTESHENYHLWSAVYAASCLLGKKCFLDRGTYVLHPNLYVIIVGEAAARKSSAMKVAERLVKSVGDICIAPTSSSREALVDFMGENPIECEHLNTKFTYHQVSVFANEFDSFLGGTHLNKGLITFLTDIWDSTDYTDRTRKMGTITINSPYLTLIGCCVPDFFMKSVQGDIISGGFTRRGIFVFEERNQRLIARPSISKEQDEAWYIMTQEAKRMRAITGEFVLTEEAWDIYTKWYNESYEKIKTADEKLKSYYSSRYDLLLKVCMCLSACYDSKKAIDTSILKLGDKMLSSMESKLEKLFRGVGRNELVGVQYKIVEEIKKADKGKIPKSALFRRFLHEANNQEMQSSLDQLVQAGLISVNVDLVGGAGIIYSSAEAASQHSAEDLFELVCLRFGPVRETVLGSPTSSELRGVTPSAQIAAKKRSPSGTAAGTPGLAQQLLAGMRQSSAKK